MSQVIQAHHIKKTFGEIVAVDDLNLQVREGEIYGLVGPDGAGKTTTIRLLCGALRPDSGVVTVGGFDMRKEAEKAREQIGYLSQLFSLYEDLTVLENLRFFAEVRGIPATSWKPRSMEILEFVGLSEFLDRRAGYLSGGMKQKLGLATALVHSPRVLLLDEPTGGVDPLTRQDFWRLIIQLVAEKKISILISTPYMDEASRCTYVGFMMNGKLVLEDQPHILQNILENRLLELRGSPLKVLKRMISEISEVEDVQTYGDRLHIRMASTINEAMIDHLTKELSEIPEITLEEILPISPGLEDILINLLQKHEV